MINPIIISTFIKSADKALSPIIIQKDINNYNNGTALAISQFTTGLSFPTSMTFVNKNTILVLEKNKGTVRVISNGSLEENPILTLDNIDNEAERGLLGIAVLKNETKYVNNVIKNISNIDSINTHKINQTNKSILRYTVFLYFTEKIKSGDSNNTNVTFNNIANNSDRDSSNKELRNRIYKYSWDGDPGHNLENPILLMDLPAKLGPHHNGGKLKIGPDNQLYAVIGDLVTINNTLQNRHDGSNDNSNTIPNNSSVILRINPSNNSILKDNPFYKHYNNHINLKPLIYYYAYGIRNSFGMEFDPITGTLWDTENGEDNYDEINLVKPGFNSGWHKIMGPLSRNNGSNLSDLVLFKGSHYSDPVFSWSTPIGITDIEFFKSEKFGNKYENNIFVGDINNGNIYFLKVNSSRSGVDSDNTSDANRGNYTTDYKVVDNKFGFNKILFAKGFDGRITDIETGPDGNLYILTYFDGKIYRIHPA